MIFQEEYDNLVESLKTEMTKGKLGDEARLLMRESFPNRRELLRNKQSRPMHYLISTLPGFKEPKYVSINKKIL